MIVIPFDSSRKPDESMGKKVHLVVVDGTDPKTLASMRVRTSGPSVVGGNSRHISAIDELTVGVANIILPLIRKPKGHLQVPRISITVEDEIDGLWRHMRSGVVVCLVAGQGVYVVDVGHSEEYG